MDTEWALRENRDRPAAVNAIRKCIGISWEERLAYQNNMHTKIISSVTPLHMGQRLWSRWLHWLSGAARAPRIDAWQLQQGAWDFISRFLSRGFETIKSIPDRGTPLELLVDDRELGFAYQLTGLR